MKILRTVADLRKWRATQSTVGFVPTMGALHQGHLHLLKSSLNENQSTLLSIFVNPSQFSPSEDLDTYPRTFDDDVRKFAKLGGPSARAVFAPTVADMYPGGIDLDVAKQKGTFVEVLGASHLLEGAMRPHFFRGVATVVTKLLNAAQANVAYFGQKDIQQTVIVRSLVRDLLMPTAISVKETQREANGLALSSRNAYLSEKEKAEAGIIYKSLEDARKVFQEEGATSASLVSQVTSALESSPIIADIEYVSVNDLDSFDFLDTPKNGSSVLSVAVRLHNGVRLLDNVLL